MQPRRRIMILVRAGLALVALGLGACVATPIPLPATDDLGPWQSRDLGGGFDGSSGTDAGWTDVGPPPRGDAAPAGDLGRQADGAADGATDGAGPGDAGPGDAGAVDGEAGPLADGPPAADGGPAPDVAGD